VSREPCDDWRLVFFFFSHGYGCYFETPAVLLRIQFFTSFLPSLLPLRLPSPTYLHTPAAMMFSTMMRPWFFEIDLLTSLTLPLFSPCRKPVLTLTPPFEHRRPQPALFLLSCIAVERLPSGSRMEATLFFIQLPDSTVSARAA